MLDWRAGGRVGSVHVLLQYRSVFSGCYTSLPARTPWAQQPAAAAPSYRLKCLTALAHVFPL